MLNGIEDIVTRPDLADRAILLTLTPIAERQRRPEHALWREFELARPHILGALLDAVAHGLHMLPRTRLQRLPRMADFALWATACESAFRPAGTLETAYLNNRRDAIVNIVDADAVAARVCEIMADRAQWTALLASPGLAVLVPTQRHADVAATVITELPHLTGNLFHDAHTAILMREHGIGKICTRDADFSRFTFVEVIDPVQL